MSGGEGFGRLGLATRNSSSVMIEFGRVLSDLPYGIRGVQNNIGQLITMLGVGGGLGLALQAATSLAVVFEDQLISAFRNTADAAKEAEGFYRDALGAVIDFELVGSRLAVRTTQQAQAVNDFYARSRDAARKSLEDLEREERILSGRLRGGGQNVAAGLNPEEFGRLNALPGLISAARTEVTRYSEQWQEANDRLRQAEEQARVLRELGPLSLPTDRQPRPDGSRPRATGSRSAAAEGREATEVAWDLALALGALAEQQSLLNAAITVSPLVQPEYIEYMERWTDAYKQMSRAVDQGAGKADFGKIIGRELVGGVSDLTNALGELVTLQSSLGGFFESIGRAMQRMVGDIIAAIAQVVILRALLTVFGGPSTSIGGVIASAAGLGKAGGVGGGGGMLDATPIVEGLKAVQTEQARTRTQLDAALARTGTAIAREASSPHANRRRAAFAERQARALSPWGGTL